MPQNCCKELRLAVKSGSADRHEMWREIEPTRGRTFKNVHEWLQPSSDQSAQQKFNCCALYSFSAPLHSIMHKHYSQAVSWRWWIVVGYSSNRSRHCELMQVYETRALALVSYRHFEPSKALAYCHHNCCSGSVNARVPSTLAQAHQRAEYCPLLDAFHYSLSHLFRSSLCL